MNQSLDRGTRLSCRSGCCCCERVSTAGKRWAGDGRHHASRRSASGGTTDGSGRRNWNRGGNDGGSSSGWCTPLLFDSASRLASATEATAGAMAAHLCCLIPPLDSRRREGKSVEAFAGRVHRESLVLTRDPLLTSPAAPASRLTATLLLLLSTASLPLVSRLSVTHQHSLPLLMIIFT